jgi:hypothetical protein
MTCENTREGEREMKEMNEWSYARVAGEVIKEDRKKNKKIEKMNYLFKKL